MLPPTHIFEKSAQPLEGLSFACTWNPVEDCTQRLTAGTFGLFFLSLCEAAVDDRTQEFQLFGCGFTG